jgi:hypothetical protein
MPPKKAAKGRASSKAGSKVGTARNDTSAASPNTEWKSTVSRTDFLEIASLRRILMNGVSVSATFELLFCGTFKVPVRHIRAIPMFLFCMPWFDQAPDGDSSRQEPPDLTTTTTTTHLERMVFDHGCRPR